jgi:hypothetical protein
MVPYFNESPEYNVIYGSPVSTVINGSPVSTVIGQNKVKYVKTIRIRI